MEKPQTEVSPHKGLPAGSGQERGMITGDYRRPLTWQIAFPVGNFPGYFRVGEERHGHHC